MSTKKIINLKDESFPPLEATLVKDLDSQSEQSGTNDPWTWTVVGGDSKTSRNDHTTELSNDKSYKNTLRIVTTTSRMKHRKSPSSRSDGTVFVKKSSHTTKIKQELIDNKRERGEYGLIFSIKRFCVLDWKYGYTGWYNSTTTLVVHRI